MKRSELKLFIGMFARISSGFKTVFVGKFPVAASESTAMN